MRSVGDGDREQHATGCEESEQKMLHIDGRKKDRHCRAHDHPASARPRQAGADRLHLARSVPTGRAWPRPPAELDSSEPTGLEHAPSEASLEGRTRAAKQATAPDLKPQTKRRDTA